MKILGAAYLLWLAVGMVRARASVFGPDPALPRHSAGRLYGMGVTCLLNPKVALMYGALLPQYVRGGACPTGLQLIELGLVQIAVGTLANAAWVLLAARVSRLLQRSRRADRGVRWTAAGLLTYFAVHPGLARAAV